MWRMKKWLWIDSKVDGNGKRVRLPKPKRELVEERDIEDIDFIRLLVMWINVGKVTVDPMQAVDDEFKEELQNDGICTDNDTFGYWVQWISNANQVYEYQLEDLGKDDSYENNELETNSNSAHQQLGWFGSIWNHIKGR